MRRISSISIFAIVAIGSFTNPTKLLGQDLLVKTYPPSTLIGFRAGGSIISESLAEITGGASNGLKFGIDGGFDLEHWFNQDWGISTGLELTQKGVDQEYSSIPNVSVGSGDDNYSMNFIEIPVLLKRGLVEADGSDGDLRPFVCAGADFGLLVSSSETTSGTIARTGNLTSYLNNFNVSLYFGTGAMFTFTGGPTIFFDAGYETGLTKAFKSEPSQRTLYSESGQIVSTASEIIVTIGVLWKL